MISKIRSIFFKNNTSSQTFLKNTFWLFVGEAGVRIIKLGVFIYAARSLGVVEWGAFSYAIALMSLFALISDIGVNSVLIREKAKNKNYEQFISTGLVVKITLSLVASLLLVSYGLILPNTDIVKVLLPFMAVVLFLDSLREFSFTINRAFEKMEIEAFGKIITAFILAGLGLFFIKNYATAVSFSFAYIISSTIGLVIGFTFLRKELSNITQNFNSVLVRSILEEAWPLGLVSIFGVILTNVDTVILGWFKSIDVVGIYSVAQKPIQVIYMIPTLVSLAILPMFSRLAMDEDKDKIKKIFKKSINIAIASAIPVAILGATLGSKMITLLFGTSYTSAGLPFEIMCIAILFSAPGAIISNGLFAVGQQKKIARAIFLGTISNILLCLVLIPHWGIYGAAASATFAQIISNLAMYWYARKTPSLNFS